MYPNKNQPNQIEIAFCSLTINQKNTQRPRATTFPGAIRINDFWRCRWCDIHVMDARQSVNWPPYIEDDDYFREGGASNHSFLDPGNLEDERISFSPSK